MQRKEDIEKFMGRASDLGERLPLMIGSLNEKIKEISELYQKQTSSVNEDFSKLKSALEEEKRVFLVHLQKQFQEKQSYVENHVNNLTQYQNEVKKFSDDISRNFVNIIKNMEFEPFYDILSNYYSQITEIQHSIDFLKEDMIKLVKIKREQNSIEEYRKNYRNLYREKPFFLSLCETRAFIKKESQFLKARLSGKTQSEISGETARQAFGEKGSGGQGSMKEARLTGSLKGKADSTTCGEANSYSSSTASTFNGSHIHAKFLSQKDTPISKFSGKSEQKIGRPSSNFNPSHCPNPALMFDDDLKKEAQELIETVDVFVGLKNAAKLLLEADQENGKKSNRAPEKERPVSPFMAIPDGFNKIEEEEEAHQQLLRNESRLSEDFCLPSEIPSEKMEDFIMDSPRKKQVVKKTNEVPLRSSQPIFQKKEPFFDRKGTQTNSKAKNLLMKSNENVSRSSVYTAILTGKQGQKGHLAKPGGPSGAGSLQKTLFTRKHQVP